MVSSRSKVSGLLLPLLLLEVCEKGLRATAAEKAEVANLGDFK